MLPSASRLAGVTLVIMAVWITPINSSTSRKLDESSASVTPDTEVKCTPCEEHPPPSPPPPSLPPPPPPAPTNPTTQYCPPPPSSNGSPPAPFYYVTGPPGNLYPFDPYYSGSSQNSVARLQVLVGCGLLLGLLAF
ncbi:hypothetical protein NE237_007581 [Protea cynaroides]|uniref:Uncharacterized protein n=1 Tax=Protea cynaroides TaxID=273540 RepID=A0A9Q0KPH1_9MAGN|nr:hypothetical protein NE237_007581 [Protea cynaroides]